MSPDRQRKAAKAAEIQKAVDAREEIEKAEAARRHQEYLAFGVGGGSSSGYSAPAAPSWGTDPAAPVQQHDPRYSALIKQDGPFEP